MNEFLVASLRMGSGGRYGHVGTHMPHSQYTYTLVLSCGYPHGRKVRLSRRNKILPANAFVPTRLCGHVGTHMRCCQYTYFRATPPPTPPQGGKGRVRAGSRPPRRVPESGNPGKLAEISGKVEFLEIWEIVPFGVDIADPIGKDFMIFTKPKG